MPASSPFPARSALARHARVVEAVVCDPSAAESVDPRIRDSWQRCLTRYALDPSRPRRASSIAARQLRQRREQLGQLPELAQIEIGQLRALLDMPAGIMVTDVDGVIIGCGHTAGFEAIAEASGFVEGAIWSEREQGTNGMGTCLALAAPILIAGPDHFMGRNVGLTCCAAPIQDGQGQLIGAFNLSGRFALASAPTLALARIAVRNIEDRLLLSRSGARNVVRLHPQAAGVAGTGDGIVRVDAEGRIEALNRAALSWLGLHRHEQAIGRPVEQLLGLDAESLDRMPVDARSARPLPLDAPAAGCHAIVQPGTPPSRLHSRTDDAAAPDATLLGDAEKNALRKALHQCDWNVSRTANLLGVSRRTLHRKLARHRLQRDLDD